MELLEDAELLDAVPDDELPVVPLVAADPLLLLGFDVDALLTSIPEAAVVVVAG